MKSKLIFGSAIVGVIVLLLTVSGSITQASYAGVQYQQVTANEIQLNYLLEDMRITAGINSAALVQLHLFGGPDPAITTNALFDNNIINWLFILSDQDNYANYLLRRPFRAPDNFSLALEISGSMGADGSLHRALSIAELFSTTYNTVLRWTGATKLNNGNYLYFFGGGALSSHFGTVLSEIKSDVDSGMTTLITQSIIDSAPVKVLAIGQGTFPVDETHTLKMPVRGIYFVSANAITGTSQYTLSTDNIFNQDLVAFHKVGYISHSELHFRFPYTINPISISPRPNNIAPQITGKMDWRLTLRNGNVRPPNNYEVVFEINNDALVSSPRVSVNMGYNQTMLQHDGILKMDYTVSNTGTETATNITISYPLGEDFVNFVANKPDLFRLRDDVTIDTSIYTEINATIVIDFEGSLFNGYSDITYEQRVLVLSGWYINTTNGEWVDWNSSMTSALIKSDTASFNVGGITGTITTSITLSDPDGLDMILVNRAIEFLAPINLNDYTGKWSDIFGDYSDALGNGVAKAADDLFKLLYQPQSVFDPNLMDFEFVEKTVGFGDFAHTEYFLQTVIPQLDPGQSTTVSWALENITSQFMTFGVMRPELIDNGDDHKAIKLVTEEHNFEEVMQMLFAIADDKIPNSQFATGRFISYYDPNTDTWISSGARFSYSDPEGFEYFGFSNGINFQLADDEAVLNVHVALNSTGYTVGDPVHIDFTIDNSNGNTAAHNVKLYLVHGRMGGDWQIRDPEIFYTEDVGTIEAGGVYTGSVDVLANTYLGIHPVYAVVEFDSDYGQGPLEAENWFTGEHNFFDGAKQTHEIVISNMDWAMLLPKTNERKPAFPQPVLDIQTIPNFIVDKTPWELELQYVITNVGDEPTTITVIQYYNTSEMELLSRTTTKGNIGNGTYLGMGVITAENIHLAPGESVTITMRWLFLTSSGCYIPGAQVIYDSRFENEIGGDIESSGGEGQGGMLPLNALDGQSQDTNQWEDYGESTSTGSSAGADIYTGGEHTRRIGSMDLLYFSISAILVTSVVFTARKKHKI